MEIVKKSKADKGCLIHLAPVLYVEKESLPQGVFEGSAARSYRLKVLGGNHQITAAKNLWGRERLVACRIYLEFEPKLLKVIADSG